MRRSIAWWPPRFCFVLLAILSLASPAAAELIFADGFEIGLCPWGDDITCLSDDFEDGDFVGWALLNPEDADLSVAGGELRIEPHANTLWFNASTSIALSRFVSGDFRATATVTARRLPPNEDDPPNPTVRLGGLMARDPLAEGGENYLFIVVGGDVNDVAVETKSTIGSMSEFMGPPWPSASGELRICRVAGVWRVAIRELTGGAWEEQLPPFPWPDLPNTVEVGLMAYANQSDPDLRVSVDGIDFEPVAVPSDCFP